MRKIFFGLFLLFIACNNDTKVPPRPPPVVTDTEYCKQAEENLKFLGCIPSDKPYTKGGKEFKQFCEEKQRDGIFLNPKCLATITSCGENNKNLDLCTYSTVK